MKKKYFLLFFLCLGLLPLQAQKSNKKDKPHRWQLGINATDLLGRATGLQPVVPVLTSPYDLQFIFSPKKKLNFRLGIGYQIPESEVSSGAVNEANRRDHTLHLRLGFSKNKFLFEDKWIWNLGFDYIYSRRIEKEFTQEELSLHVITNENGFGTSSGLQYCFTPRFSLGVEMALYLSFSVRERLIPEPDITNLFSSFFEPDNRIHGRMFVPIELFAFYKF